MKYSLQGLLLALLASSLFANSNRPTKPATKASQCNVNNNYFIAGSSFKKIENMFSEIKQELAEIKQEIKEIKENQTGGHGGKGL